MAQLVQSSQHVYCEHCCKFVSRKTRYNHLNRQNKETICQDIDSRTDSRKRRRQQLDCSLNQETSTPKQHRAAVVDPQCTHEQQQSQQQITSSIPDFPRPDNDVNSVSDDNGDIDDGLSTPSTLKCTNLLEEVDASYIFEDLSEHDTTISTDPTCDSLDSSILSDTSDENFTEVPKDTGEPVLQRAQKIVSWVIASVFSIQVSHNISDAAMLKFLLLLKQIFCVLSPCSSLISIIAKVFPKTLYMARKVLNIPKNNFMKYVVCPKCCALYSYEGVVTEQQFKKCTNMVFSCRAALPSRKKGKVKCDAVLVDETVLKDGRKSVSPKRVYCYQGLIDILQHFLLRPTFVEKCNAWRNRGTTSNLYADIYDGEIWKSFYKYKGSDFLTDHHHFGVMLNVDWFQPFQRRNDISIGALYMVFMNLPREERFKKENSLLIGIIPSLSKEPENLNAFLSPLVSELKALWKGVQLVVPSSPDPVCVKVALMCAAADIPAARKLCGFLGHAAIQGCSSCTKPLWTEGVHDCGIPDLSKWPRRNKTDHLKCVAELEKADCLSKAKEIEKKHGYRSTALLELSYFEPAQMTAVDPMHNLFLGTAKKMFTFWVEKELLTKSNLDTISSKIESVTVPSDMGRIPVNISSNYGQMTAKEWKNWVLVYSLLCLNGLLPTIHLKVWQTFVLACRHFCQPCINKVNVEIASKLMVKFCTQVAQLYGKEFLTPNMHLHCHLHESVKNFGSMYGFWLFSFERYNGIMSDFHTNKKGIEDQLMKKFLLFSSTSGECVDPEFSLQFEQVSESGVSNIQFSSCELFSVPTSSINQIKPHCWSDMSQITFKHKSNSSVVGVGKQLLDHLCKVYSFIYNRPVLANSISSVYTKYSSVYFNNESLSSEMNTRSLRNSYIFASWADDNTALNETSLRLCKIQYFVKSVIKLSTGQPVEHVFAYVEWFKCSSSQLGYLNPVTVWSTKVQNDGPATLLPLQRIYSKAAWRYETHSSQRFIVAVPVPRTAFM